MSVKRIKGGFEKTGGAFYFAWMRSKIRTAAARLLRVTNRGVAICCLAVCLGAESTAGAQIMMIDSSELDPAAIRRTAEEQYKFFRMEHPAKP